MKRRTWILLLIPLVLGLALSFVGMSSASYDMAIFGGLAILAGAIVAGIVVAVHVVRSGEHSGGKGFLVGLGVFLGVSALYLGVGFGGCMAGAELKG